MTTIQLSYNEIFNLARKAASGAGLPFGITEEIGRAAVWLSGRGLDGIEIILAALEGPPLNRIIEGLSALDLLQAHREPSSRTVDAAHCALLVIALAGAAESAAGMRFALRIHPVALVVGALDKGSLSSLAGMSTLIFERLDGHAPEGSGHEALARPPATETRIFDAASALAARTYVPATEASRLMGAGAGTREND